MSVGSKRVTSVLSVVTVAWLVAVVLSATSVQVPRPLTQSGMRGDDSVARSVVQTMLRRTVALEVGQAPGTASGAVPLVDSVYKNVQVLKGIPVDDFLGTMGIMAASLGFCCSDCHTGAGTDSVKWEADTNPNKVTARRMVTMVTTINRDNFQGRQVVTCWTCHRGRDFPLVTPGIDDVYGLQNLKFDDVQRTNQFGPNANQIIDKYLVAIGGAQRWAAVTSWTAKAKGSGFGGLGGSALVDVFAKGPDQRATYIHFPQADRGDSVRTYNGSVAWLATPRAALRKYQVFGGELDGARLDALMSFPAQLKQALTNLRAVANTSIDDHVMDVVQGTGARGLIATLYFDQKSGLLTRVVRLVNSPIGRVPTQIDYADYRDVNGLKVPFNWTFSWLDGQDSFELTDFQVNVAIDSAKFGEPNPLPGK